jgi:large conductance mechanosensitive channel
MGIFKRFRLFLLEYRIIGISIGFIVAIAASNFIQSLVNDVILPMLRPLISKGSTTWEEIILPLGSVNIRIGSFLSTLLNLIFILILLYFIIVKVLKWKPRK